MKRLIMVLCFLVITSSLWASELWRITAYCPCVICTEKTPCDEWYNITASGKEGRYGIVAGNWLPFGTKVRIEGLGVFEVQDRGARRFFGDKNNHKKALDIYFPTHQEARNFGVQYKRVTIIRKGGRK